MEKRLISRSVVPEEAPEEGSDFSPCKIASHPGEAAGLTEPRAPAPPAALREGGPRPESRGLCRQPLGPDHREAPKSEFPKALYSSGYAPVSAHPLMNRTSRQAGPRNVPFYKERLCPPVRPVTGCSRGGQRQVQARLSRGPPPGPLPRFQSASPSPPRGRDPPLQQRPPSACLCHFLNFDQDS